MNQIDFTLKVLCSEYKKGIDIYQPQWYSQSKYYYFEEFMEDNNVKTRKYDENQVEYEKDRMYWLGYCLQEWSNKVNLTGKKIAEVLGEKGVEHLLRNYKIYHTVDSMYVLKDTFNIKLS